jgi:hypothetical protein
MKNIVSIITLMVMFVSCEMHNPHSTKDGCGKWSVYGTNNGGWTRSVSVTGIDSINWITKNRVWVYRNGLKTSIFAEEITTKYYDCR